MCTYVRVTGDSHLLLDLFKLGPQNRRRKCESSRGYCMTVAILDFRKFHTAKPCVLKKVTTLAIYGIFNGSERTRPHFPTLRFSALCRAIPPDYIFSRCRFCHAGAELFFKTRKVTSMEIERSFRTKYRIRIYKTHFCFSPFYMISPLCFIYLSSLISHNVQAAFRSEQRSNSFASDPYSSAHPRSELTSEETSLNYHASSKWLRLVSFRERTTGRTAGVL